MSCIQLYGFGKRAEKLASKIRKVIKEHLSFADEVTVECLPATPDYKELIVVCPSSDEHEARLIQALKPLILDYPIELRPVPRIV